MIRDSFFRQWNLTRVDYRFLRAHPEEEYGRKGENSEFLCQLLVVDFDEIYSRAVGLVVYVLDLRQHSGALLAVFAV